MHTLSQGAIAPLSRRERHFFTVMAGFLLLGLVLPRVVQPEAYHCFADNRVLWGIPHAGDVLTNLAFFAVGLFGLRSLSRRKDDHSPAFLWAVEVFFWGVLLTAAGSAYYHWAPSDTTLIWDRLPMTVAFAGACAALAACRVSQRAGFVTLATVLPLGAWSVVYWAQSGNLTPYAVMQFGGIAWMTVACLFGRATGREDLPWGSLLVWYGIAKACETWDLPINQALHGLASGHNIKHVTAAIGALCVAMAIRRGQAVRRSA